MMCVIISSFGFSVYNVVSVVSESLPHYAKKNKLKEYAK